MRKGFGSEKPKKGGRKIHKAYLKLIFALLDCSRAKIPELLRANQNLINAELVQTMVIVAMMLAKGGKQEQASFLMNIAGNIKFRLSNAIVPKNEVLDFVAKVLQVSYETSGDSQILYPLLEANIDKLNDNFVLALRCITEYIRSQVNLEKVAQFCHEVKSGITEPSNLDSSLEDIHTASGMIMFTEPIMEFPKGNKAINIEIAIAGHDLITSVFTRETYPEQWAGCQIDLGVAYRRRVYGDRSSNLEQAILCYKNSLQILTSKTFPEVWADTLNNLAIAYSERIQGNRADNLEQAIAYCQEVLKLCTTNAFPEQWGSTHLNLGNFWKERVYGDQGENLELSIHCYKDALQVFTCEAFPEEWSNIQDGLGLSYCNRIKGDRVENQEQAIKYFQAALEVRNYEAFPVKWVTTQSHLGTVYWQRVKGEKAQNLELAIDCYQKALQIATLLTMPQEWAMVQINLGAMYSDRIKGNRQKNLEAALHHFTAASKVYTKRDFPQKWATLQNNLGLFYGKLGLHSKQIQCLQASLKECTRKAFPSDWASTQYNLGIGYRKLGQIEKAIDCLRLSLEIFQPTTFPLDCLDAAHELADTAFDQKCWCDAIEGYNLAIKAVETSRTWATSETRRQEILEESIDVYQNMVQACINAGQVGKAFEYSERSRSKRLVDLMASYNLSQGEEIPPKVQELLQQYEELQRQIDQERQSHKSENSRSDTRAAWEAYNEAIATLETQKQQVWENLRREDPVLAGEIQVNPLKLSEIQKLIDQPNTAILSFYTTNSDTHIFVVQQNQITLHTCTGQGLDTLQSWIEQNWLLPYMNDSQKWETQINSILRELAERLQISELISEHLQGIEELILVPHLLLHQIPFAALPTGEYQEYLGDKFLIRYTPSCQILEFCQQRDPVGTNEISLQYGTVEDAEDNLPCARFEGEKLAQMCNIPPENRLIGSSQATSNNYRQLAQEVQVLHSCHHAQSRLDNPLESQLKLADSSITLGQLMTPSWRLPQLVEVFLSCCETNLGTPSLTDDILTLSTGFLCAGARSVISTLWSVNDLATALFSIFYYQNRQEGNNRPEALQKAQIQLREFTKLDLNQIFKEVEAREKVLIVNRKKYPSDSMEYQQWKLEYNMYAKLNRRIKEIENSTQQFPFSHPRYWAAFICYGLP
ncbi:CHAT domain-containing protein [Nostoc sp. C117]|uniref:CHAT domain-containing protein n=1 Tax=Nostoc sp. C117 TaxID=3349875 RepID=UPI00370D1321